MSKYLLGTFTTTSSWVGPVRCAIYARFSSDNQKDSSIVDQIRNCRELAERNGWVILEEHIYTDEEKTGTTIYGRDGLADLMAAAESKPKPFDYILFDDTSRFGRNKAECLKNADIIRFLGIGMYFVEGDLDSAHPSFESVYHQNVYRDQEYSKSLAHKVRRGKRGRFLAGYHPGNICYGYLNLAIEDPTRKGEYGRPAVIGVKQVINPEEGKIVLWIFEAYASGMSLLNIAADLNARGVPTATGSRGKRNAHWCKSAINEMLKNRRYVGETTWGRTRQDRDPRNGKPVTQSIPEENWDRMSMPELRIISDELFARVQQQMEVRSARFGVKRSGGMARTEASRKYLLSGLMRCGQCGGNMIIVTNKPPRYGCAGHRESKTCSNKMTVVQAALENHLLSRLSGHLRSEELREALVEGVLEHLNSKNLSAANRRSQSDANQAQIRADRKAVEAEIENVLAAIRAGGAPPKILVDEVARLGAKRDHLDDLLSQTSKPTVPKEINEREVRLFLDGALGRLQEIISGSAENVRAELQKRISALVLVPSVDATGPLYTITGDVALFSAPEGAVQTGQPPLDALHYNLPISVEYRPYRRLPKGLRGEQCSRRSESSDPRIPGSDEDCESTEVLKGDSVVLHAVNHGNTSGLQAI